MRKNYIAPAFKIEKFHVEDVMNQDASYVEVLGVNGVFPQGIMDGQITFGEDANLLQAISYSQFTK